MNKIKVVNVITDTNIGGAGRVLENYLAHYDDNIFNICVILPGNSELQEIIKKQRATVIAFEKLKGKSMSPGSIIPLIKLFKKLKPDIVHTHACFSARIAARLYGKCKIVYTRHCVFPPSLFMRSIPGKIIGRVVSILFSSRVIAISPAAKENLVDTGVSKRKIDVLMNGVEPLRKLSGEEKKAFRNKYGISESDHIVGMIGRLEAVKGHIYFINAAKICVEKNISLKFLIAGSGSMENELKDMAGDNIIFTGFLEDVAGAVNIIDVFVNASYGTEASSLAILEAMSLGKPVVATDYGGNPYQVSHEETGLLVPVKETEALAEAILDIISDKKKYRKFAKNALSEYKSKYTARAMTENIESVYMKMLKK